MKFDDTNGRRWRGGRRFKSKRRLGRGDRLGDTSKVAGFRVDTQILFEAGFHPDNAPFFLEDIQDILSILLDCSFFHRIL